MQTTIDAIEESALAKETKRAYISRARKLYSVDAFPNDMEKVIDQMTPSGNESSKLTISNTILALYKLSPDLKKRISKTQHLKLLVINDEIKDKEKERRKDQPDKETDKTWKSIQSMKSAFEKLGGEDLLIYRVFTQMPVVARLDYTPLELVETSKEANDPKMNYYIRNEGVGGTIELRSHKTQGRYGTINLPLKKEWKAWMPKNQKYLFEAYDDQALEPNSLGKKLTRAFKRAGLSRCESKCTAPSICNVY